MKNVMKVANKPTLADAMWNLIPPGAQQPSDECAFVIDGGSLLHHILWQKGTTYGSICERYVAYVQQHYGKATVVFDGYLTGSSKKTQHTIKKSKKTNYRSSLY